MTHLLKEENEVLISEKINKNEFLMKGKNICGVGGGVVGGLILNNFASRVNVSWFKNVSIKWNHCCLFFGIKI